MKNLPLIPALFLALTASVCAAEAPPKSEADILKSVKLPDGYEATVFAMPPHGGYPTSVSAAIDGTIFVAIDENGSLGRDRNLASDLEADAKRRPGNPGKVVRMRDTDGDGKADEFKTFAEMESPRGVIWDGPSGTAPGTLYVMSPPKLTAFTDTDGDGVSDKQEDILTGLGFDLGFRGADHTTNGCRLAIDGFIYIAVGDYGFSKAVAKDGTTLSMRGGGIVRVRPDGTGFEIVSRGQRNIYDVAVSPTLDLFTRDNTNDGGGWNVRLSHVPPGAHMGYPTLFINFPEDIVQPLADLGGGSPCGALWLDEPGLPGGLFTVEWGRNAIMRHTLKAKGAGWEIDGPKKGEEEWIKLTRPTDMDVDARGTLYITSWEGATFDYNGPNAGYVLRVVKKDAPATATPPAQPPVKSPAMFGSPKLDVASSIARAPVVHLGDARATVRLAASRHLIRLAATGTFSALSNQRVAVVPKGDRLAQIIAFAATKAELQRMGETVNWKIVWLEPSADEAAFAAMVIGEPGCESVAKASLQKPQPRIRAAAITALRRLGKADAAPAILPLVADPDPIISHLAIRALSELKASPACLAALDAADEAVKPGALQALYGIPTTEVVDGLIARLGSTPVSGVGRGVPPRRTSETAPITNPPTPSAATSPQVRDGGTPSPARGTRALPGTEATDPRRGLLNALCRLANVDAPYADPKEWWGTRPDTSGPVYKPAAWAETDKIQAALKRELDTAKGEDARWLVQRLYLCKVNLPGLVEQMLAACGTDTPARLTAIAGLFRADQSLPPEAVAALAATAVGENETPDFRARALRLLQRGASHGSIFPTAVSAFAPLAGHEIGQPAISAAFEDFTRDAKHTKWIKDWEKLAEGSDAAKRTLAQTILVNLATSALVKGKDREAAEKAVDKAWAKPDTAASMLGVIARTKAKPLAGQVTAHLKDPSNAVAEAALFAYQALGLKDTGAPAAQIASMKYEAVFAAVQKGGDAAEGRDIYLRAGCVACHTLTADEPAKGPILSAVAKIYDRAALTESLLKPNAKLAQGFETATFKTKKDGEIQGFVTREGGDSVDVRNIAGQIVTIEKGDITARGKSEQSMMPEGLLNTFTPADVANLLAFLESLKGK